MTPRNCFDLDKTLGQDTIHLNRTNKHLPHTSITKKRNTQGGGGSSGYNGAYYCIYIMRDKQYKAKAIRMDEPVWDKLMQLRKSSGLTWNLFIKELIKAYETRRKG